MAFFSWVFIFGILCLIWEFLGFLAATHSAKRRMLFCRLKEYEKTVMRRKIATKCIPHSKQLDSFSAFGRIENGMKWMTDKWIVQCNCVHEFMALVTSFFSRLFGRQAHTCGIWSKKQPNAEVKCYPSWPMPRGWMCQISHTLREAHFFRTVHNSPIFLLFGMKQATECLS